MSGNVTDASVTIDDIYLGSLSYVQKRGVAVPPGKHRLTVEKVGYFPWDKLIEAGVLRARYEPVGGIRKVGRTPKVYEPTAADRDLTFG